MNEEPARFRTFLFTDIEGSTRRWESDPTAMTLALTEHDSTIQSAVRANGGSVFKHTGDGMCAIFDEARDAVEAAVEAQHNLRLPVRMGISSGEAEDRDGDYFGTVLNRTARVMSAGHGGQILLSETTLALVKDLATVNLGKHLLRDIPEEIGIFQVVREGLAEEFPALKTATARKGNLPVATNELVGRHDEIKQLSEILLVERLVTLTGVGGVGKTSLATEVGRRCRGEFGDGAWLIELAPVGDQASVPESFASALGITPVPGLSITESICRSLSGQKRLLIIDNCEHVLAAAAEIALAIIKSTTSVGILATSRESLGVLGEQRWSIAPLDVRSGAQSAAVELFVQRARRADPAFDPSDDEAAIIQICRQLDGIALGIELAASRMASMSPGEVRDRLGDRFRLLSEPRRKLKHHQTLKQAVQWSYDLLDPEEQDLLCHCSVFADGFDLASACRDFGVSDEFVVLDLLDSLVRKSLVTVERIDGKTRYGMLETIRRFAFEDLERIETADDRRDEHARFFADMCLEKFEQWDGPNQLQVLNWIDAEFANLRIAFQWAQSRSNLSVAAQIASRTAIMAFVLHRFEPITWSEQILVRATEADIVELPQLFTAASICCYAGRPEDALVYAEQTQELVEQSGKYEILDTGWSSLLLAVAYRYNGQQARALELCESLAAEEGLSKMIGLCGVVYNLTLAGRFEEAEAAGDKALTAAKAYQSPFWVAWALESNGRVYAQSDPGRALSFFRECLEYSRHNRLAYFAATVTRQGAMLEAANGDLEHALELFDEAIDTFHRAGNVTHLAMCFGALAEFFASIGELHVAATCLGVTGHLADTDTVAHTSELAERLRTSVDVDGLEKSVSEGARMDPGTALAYARTNIQMARRMISTDSDG